MVSPARRALYAAMLLSAMSPTWAKQQPEYLSALPPKPQEPRRRIPTRTTPAPTASVNDHHNDVAADTTPATGGRMPLPNARLSDLVRFDFSGSVETHVVGPTMSHHAAQQDDGDDAVRQLPLFAIGRTNTGRPEVALFRNLLVPSLYVGADYDFGPQQGQQQRRWHGISFLLTRLRFRPTSALAVDVSRDQSMIVDLPSSTAVQCSWRGLRSTLRTMSSRSKSVMVSIPILPSRLQWECRLSSEKDLSDDSSAVNQLAADRRSGWRVDAMGQIQGAQSFRLSDHLNARCSLRRRIRWISSDEGVAESTHLGLSLQCRHGSQSSTMATFAAQLEQLQETARLRIRHDVAIGNLLPHRSW
jgi:hypothetical protein